jgi:glycosyltransferase involved in cell wall biosynthesis
MTKSPLVSFIIPYFNAGETIQETIDSIFNQSYINFDIWLINDGSTDTQSIKKLKDFVGNEKIPYCLLKYLLYLHSLFVFTIVTSL